jgi:hypothetical protein
MPTYADVCCRSDAVGESLDSSQTASESESRALEGLRPTFRGGGGVSRSGASCLQELSSAVSLFLFAQPPLFFFFYVTSRLMCPRFHSGFYSRVTRVARVAYSYSHERACIEAR